MLNRRFLQIAVAGGSPYLIEYLLIGGGGAGGSWTGTFVNQFAASGGGAGGLLTSYGSVSGGGDTTPPDGIDVDSSSSENTYDISGSTVLSVYVGAGATSGAGAAAGGNSRIEATGMTTITAYGGGSGGSEQDKTATRNGGCGGGEVGHSRIAIVTVAAGTGVANQGFQGGGAAAPGGGGGGGTAEQGDSTFDYTSDSFAGEDGGDGTAVNIITTAIATAQSVGEVSSSNVYWGGGGGGDGYNASADGSGGLGGGANGGVNNGTDYTGGGGGASNTSSTAGGNGGKGVVILRMPTASFTGTVSGSPTEVTDGSDTILIFKGNGSYTV